MHKLFKNKLRIAFYSTLLIGLASCAITPKFSPKNAEIDEIIEIFIQAEHLSPSDFRVKLISYSFADLGENAQGSIIGLANPLIIHVYLDRAYWRTATKIERLSLVIHELKHAVLFEEHNDEISPDTGCYKSVMASSTQSEICTLFALLDYYVERGVL